MNFALAIPDSDFQLSPYLEQICDELTVYGYKFEISDRLKADTTVRKAFVKLKFPPSKGQRATSKPL